MLVQWGLLGQVLAPTVLGLGWPLVQPEVLDVTVRVELGVCEGPSLAVVLRAPLDKSPEVAWSLGRLTAPAIAAAALINRSIELHER